MRKLNTFIVILGAILILSFIGSRINNHLSYSGGDKEESKNLEKFSEIVEYVSTY